ncbi:DUF1192 domain-containing protein [Indioceanicola profundi]|uniref:DUF1192 domain-containing protein n=1 Tax=Indioceanicola profundi TaxID=2220096 RepID=UPI00298DB5B5|nr:DUF1192 domain-containing protein [Indioceanicola profundi]
MAIDLDELMPRKAPNAPKDLKPMSIGELQTYITELEAEIARARAEIQAKEAVRAGAEAFFKR